MYRLDSLQTVLTIEDGKVISKTEVITPGEKLTPEEFLKFLRYGRENHRQQETA